MPWTSTFPPGAKVVGLDKGRHRWELRTDYDDRKPDSARVNFDKDRRALLATGKIAISKPHVWVLK